MTRERRYRAVWRTDRPQHENVNAERFFDHVREGDPGTGLDFLVGKNTRPITRKSH